VGELKRSHLETNILWDITCLTPNVLHTCERCRSTSGNFYLGETQAILAQLDEVMMASCWVKFMDLKKSGLVWLWKNLMRNQRECDGNGEMEQGEWSPGFSHMGEILNYSRALPPPILAQQVTRGVIRWCMADSTIGLRVLQGDIRWGSGENFISKGKCLFLRRFPCLGDGWPT